MDLDWMDQAKCRGEDPSLFYPELLDGPGRYNEVDRAHIEEAKKICNLCPVRNICLDYAMRTRERYGIWGGTLPGERETMRRRKKELTA